MTIDWLACARQAIESWSIDVKSIRFINHSENVTFQVTDESDNKYVLRIHRPEYHTLKELESEQAWTESLLDAGVDVPVPIKTAKGHRFGSVPVGDHRRNVGMLKWVDGTSLRDLGKTKADSNQIEYAYRRVGRILAALHDQVASWQPPLWFTRHSLDADGLMGESPFWGRFWEAGDLDISHRKHLSNMRKQLHELLVQLPKNHDCYSLIHSDLHTGNIIRHGDDLHIIDFDDAGFGWHAYDFAVVLSDAPTNEDGSDSIAKVALFQGYEEIRPIQSWVKKLVPLFSVIRTFASIGWADARPELNRDKHLKHRLYEFGSKDFDAVVQRAQGVISRIQANDKTRHNAQSVVHTLSV